MGEVKERQPRCTPAQISAPAPSSTSFPVATHRTTSKFALSRRKQPAVPPPESQQPVTQSEQPRGEDEDEAATQPRFSRNAEILLKDRAEQSAQSAERQKGTDEEKERKDIHDTNEGFLKTLSPTQVRPTAVYVPFRPLDLWPLALTTLFPTGAHYRDHA